MNNYEKPSTTKNKTVLVRLRDNYSSEMLHRNDNKLI